MMNQSYVPSTNGLQSYAEASPDYELAPIGIASMRDQVQRLAEFGRNGDVYVIHAAEGETVIPMEVLEANPQIKTLLFNQMAEMGLDPQRYIVGDQLNSLNPVTGMPEFFVSSIFKGVKKAVKKVVKFAKKIAPIAIPLAAAAFGFPAFMGQYFAAGTIGASMLGTGIGSLIGGASIKDALKSSLMAGAATGIFAGAKGFLGAPAGQGAAGFGAGVKASFTGMTPIYGAATAGGAGELLGYRQAPSFGQSWESAFGEGGNFLETVSPFSDPTAGKFTPTATGPFGPTPDINIPAGATAYVPGTYTPPTGGTTGYTDFFVHTGDAGAGAKVGSEASDTNWLKNLFSSTPSPSLPDQLSAANLNVPLNQQLTMAEALQQGVISAPGGLLGSGTGPLGLPGTGNRLVDTAMYGAGAYGIGSVTGAFDPAEEEKITQADMPDIGGYRRTLAERQALADEQELQQAALDPYHFTPNPDVLQMPNLFGAAGGSVNYPERDLLVEGPGTERSDNIPAMLSDGEFVINSRAVRGADPSGRGNRYAGAQNLYNLMRNFEMRA